jgi:hypothetical protein
VTRNNTCSVEPITAPPNNLGYNIDVGRQITRTTSATSTTGMAINPAVMSNSTPDGHHYVLVHFGTEVVGSTGLTNVYYNIPLWLMDLRNIRRYNEA